LGDFFRDAARCVGRRSRQLAPTNQQRIWARHAPQQGRDFGLLQRLRLRQNPHGITPRGASSSAQGITPKPSSLILPSHDREEPGEDVVQNVRWKAQRDRHLRSVRGQQPGGDNVVTHAARRALRQACDPGCCPTFDFASDQHLRQKACCLRFQSWRLADQPGEAPVQRVDLKQTTHEGDLIEADLEEPQRKLFKRALRQVAATVA
jgi:hypothetical protein